MVLNMSFEELGPALYSDACWWTVAVAMTTKISIVVGGWSRMLRDYLKLALFSPTGFMKAGMVLQLRGQLAVIHARVKIMLSDGDGLRQALQWMGSGSLKPCFRHWNVLKKNSNRTEHDASETYVEITCPDPTKFQCWDHHELATAVDVCVAADAQHLSGRMSQARLDETRMHLGYRATAEGLLADPELRDAIDWLDVLRYDWPHTFLSDGVLGAEMWALIDKAEELEIFTRDHVVDFLEQPWRFPSSATGDNKYASLAKLFNEHARKSSDEAKTLKASMSQFLGLYGLLRHFVEVSAGRDHRLRDLVYNFMLVCKALDLLLAAKRRRLPPKAAGEQLMATLQAHLASHMRTHAGGDDRVRPKTHWGFDVAECLQRDDFVFDCFATERLHQRAKAVAQHCKNLTTYETSVMSGITNSHVRMLASHVGPAGLEGEIADFHGWVVADKLRYYGVFVQVDNFVVRGAAMGRARGPVRHGCAGWVLSWRDGFWFFTAVGCRAGLMHGVKGACVCIVRSNVPPR